MANIIDFKSELAGDTIVKLNQLNQELSSLAGQAARVQDILGVGAGVRVDVQAKLSTGSVYGSSVSSALSAMTRGIRATSSKASSMSSILRTICNKILETESNLAGKTLMSTTQAAQALHYPTDTSQWSSAMWDEYYKLADGTDATTLSDGRTIVQKDGSYYIYGADGRLIASFEKDTDWHSNSMTYKEYNSDGSFREQKVDADLNILDSITLYEDKPKDLLKKFPKNQEKYYDENGNLLKGDEAKAAADAMKHERVATIGEIGLSASGKIGMYQNTSEYTSDSGTSTHTTLEAMTLEGHASLKGGLYVEKVGPDGKSHLSLSPGIAAEIGFDATAAHMDTGISQKLFGDAVELSADASVDVGHVGAKAEGQLGMVDGKFAANVSAKAEANLVEAKASGSVDVGGVKGTVGGSVSVGLGGHAEAGYYDGHIKCDIGLSVGIGVSVNVDLDVSGVVDNVVSFVGDAAETVSGWCESAGEVLSNLWPW